MEVIIGGFSIVFCYFNYIWDQVVVFWMGQGDIYIEVSYQIDDVLWYREWFVIVWRVGLGYGDFFIFQVFQ